MTRAIKKRALLCFGTFLALILITSVISLPFYPSCTFYETPETIMPGWNESFDSADIQKYCMYDSETLFISQRVGINRLGEPFTSSNADLFFPLLTPIQESGNVKGVVVEFDYYFPNFTYNSNNFCVPNSINGVTGYFNSPQLVMLANHQLGFPFGIDFNSAETRVNGGIVCDSWQHFYMVVDDFENDYGSSFSARSKTLGTFGFEMKNVYIRNVTITGNTQTFRIF
jgi:hypothetical protein